MAIFLDGKMFADATMVVALGITITGDKRFLGFVETSTENEQVLTPFLRSLMERGLDISEGVLVIVDGLRSVCSTAVHVPARPRYTSCTLVQRCQSATNARSRRVSSGVVRGPDLHPRWLKRLPVRAWPSWTGIPTKGLGLAAVQHARHRVHASKLEERSQSNGMSLSRKIFNTDQGSSRCTSTHRGPVFWAVHSRRPDLRWNRSMPSSRKGARRST